MLRDIPILLLSQFHGPLCQPLIPSELIIEPCHQILLVHRQVIGIPLNVQEQAPGLIDTAPVLVRIFRLAGFDVLSLANNHARDFGEEGRTSTMEAIVAAGMLHSGREGDFASFERNGLRIAVLAYAVTKNSNMLLDYELAEQTVREYAASHDVVIVSFHGGAEGQDATNIPFEEEEYYGEPRGDVVRFSRMVVDAGADLVIGHGPHVVRGMETYKGRLIAYSLGNFATYYGISGEGINRIAPILVVTLNGEGEFVEGRIHSTIQLRPDGPSIDPQNRALNMLRELSEEDFAAPGIQFDTDGRILPVSGQQELPEAHER